MGLKGFHRFSRALLLVLALTLACSGAAHADSFTNGQFVTYGEGLWGGLTTNPGATLLLADDASVYASTSGVLTVGLPNTGFTASFSNAVTIIGYLPAIGTAAALNQNSVNPLSTSSGSFGGDVLALQLNVDFNNAGFLKGTSNIPFGSLVLTNFGSTLSGLNGLTVSQFLGDANTCLGGGSCLESIGVMDSITANLTISFCGEASPPFCVGTPDSFAQTNLALPTSAVPEPSSLLLVASGLASLGFLRRRFLRA